MKKKDFIKYFCNYEVLNVNIYYLYDLDEYSYDINFKDLKTNPLKFTDIYIKDDQIFINFIIEYCKNNNIPYSLLATTKKKSLLEII